MSAPFFLADLLAGHATVTASSHAAHAGTSRANIVSHEPGLVYRGGTGAATEWVDVTVDAGRLIGFDTCAYLGTNLRGGASAAVADRVSVLAHPTDPTVVGDEIFPAQHVPAKSPDTSGPVKIVLTRADVVTARYFRFRVGVATDVAHPDGYLQIGTVLVGKRQSFGFLMDVDALHFLEDLSPVMTGPGFEDAKPYPPLPGWRCSFSWIPHEQWLSWIGWARQVGQSRKVLFVPEPARPERYHEQVVFGRLRQIAGRHPIHDGWQAEIEIVSGQP